MMETSPPPAPQVVVHVSPTLLGDTLTRVLRERRLEVCLYPEQDRRVVPRARRRFDLAVVTEGLAADVEADRIITLDGAGSPTWGAGEDPQVSTGEDHLARLLALIDELLGRRRGDR